MIDDRLMIPTSSKGRRLTRQGLLTRQKIIDATVTCIVRSGLAAMTVEAVMTEAETSRGSVLHQFPTRTDLIVATVERAMQVVMTEARERSALIDDPFNRVADYGHIVWETHSSPEGLALAEVFQAARWDGELSAAIRPITATAEIEIEKELVALASEGGFPDPYAMIARGWMLVATVRGLIVENSLAPNRPMILEAIAEMKQSHRRYCEAMVHPPTGLN